MATEQTTTHPAAIGAKVLAAPSDAEAEFMARLCEATGWRGVAHRIRKGQHTMCGDTTPILRVIRDIEEHAVRAALQEAGSNA